MIRRVGAVAVALLVPLLTVTPVASGDPVGVVATTPAASPDAADDSATFVDRPLAVEDGPATAPPAPRTPGRSSAATDEPSTDAPATAVVTPPVGTVRQWLGLDDVRGVLYRKDYTLRAVGEHVELWVAVDLSFPAGDCRAAVPGSTEITDAQAAAFVTAFDTTIRPATAAVYSTPPDRDGTAARLGPDRRGRGGDYRGAGERTVTLVDNIRDASWYTFPAAATSISGFFSGQLTELLDRNVMTLDAFDWTHRSGAQPPDDRTEDVCNDRPARPFAYESTFAHEWQHLLRHYTAPDGPVWLDEGLSEVAQSLTGYVDARAGVDTPGAESHLFCFQGFGPVPGAGNPSPRDCGGPANSLTRWGDGEGPGAVQADYGNAYQFLLYLADRFGTGILTELHHDRDRQGLAAVAAALTARGGPGVTSVLHDYQASVYLDALVDAGATVVGVDPGLVNSASVSSTVNLANPAVNAGPGVAPNGADYVPLADAEGGVLGGAELTSLAFHGATSLPVAPLDWSVVTDDPARPGDAVLAARPNAPAMLPVTVPVDDPTVRLLARCGGGTARVTVDTDGVVTDLDTLDSEGVATTALPCTDDSWRPVTWDLSAWAGRDVTLGVTWSGPDGGLRLDDLSVGGVVVLDGTGLGGLVTPEGLHPVPVGAWTLTLIGTATTADGITVTVDRRTVDSDLTLGPDELAGLAGSDRVVVVISSDDPAESRTAAAPYVLTANGVLQPGGNPELLPQLGSGSNA